MAERQRSSSVRIEGSDVRIRVSHKPFCAKELVTQWFDFKDGSPLDPSIYSIPREDGTALKRALRNIRRFRRSHQLNEIEGATLDSVQNKISSAQKHRRIWPEDF